MEEGWHNVVVDQSKPKLLLIDDEPDMLDFLERVLRRKYDVTRTSSAEVALDLLAEGDFEVLVTDQKMPKVSGLELLSQISGKYPNLVRILLSGFTEVPEIQRAIEAHTIHNYVLKPIDRRRLMQAIDDAYLIRDGKRQITPK